MEHHDYLLLTVGLARSALWLVAVLIFLRLRRVLPRIGTLGAVGSGLLVISATLFALDNAHWHLPELLFVVAILASTPGVALVVTAIGLTVAYVVRLKRSRG